MTSAERAAFALADRDALKTLAAAQEKAAVSRSTSSVLVPPASDAMKDEQDAIRSEPARLNVPSCSNVELAGRGAGARRRVANGDASKSTSTSTLSSTVTESQQE